MQDELANATGLETIVENIGSIGHPDLCQRLVPVVCVKKNNKGVECKHRQLQASGICCQSVL
eukprot:1835316-Amphidinium_carterae.1